MWLVCLLFIHLFHWLWCSMWDISSGCNVGSSSWSQGSNPGSPHWEYRVIATRPQESPCYLYKKGKFGHRHAQRKDAGRRQTSIGQGERSQKKLTLPTPWSWTSSPQNCEKMNFYLVSHSVCNILLWQPRLTSIESIASGSRSPFCINITFKAKYFSNKSLSVPGYLYEGHKVSQKMFFNQRCPLLLKQYCLHFQS